MKHFEFVSWHYFLFRLSPATKISSPIRSFMSILILPLHQTTGAHSRMAFDLNNLHRGPASFIQNALEKGTEISVFLKR